MTRFARSKGKSGSGSNPKRTEEEATPWHVMVQGLKNKQNENFEDMDDDDQDEVDQETKSQGR